MAMPRKEQFSGCLVGQCLGDALGFPVEGALPAVCSRYVDEYLRSGQVPDGSRGVFPFGQYTDDSQLARELMQSYASCARFDPSDYAARIAAIFSENRIVGRGRATDEAARRLACGVPWDESGTPSPSAGNGSAMRAGPIGLLFFDDPNGLLRAAVDQGRITHKDARCSAGAVAIAGAVALAVQYETVDTTAFVSQLCEWTAPLEQVVASGVAQLDDWIALPPEEAVTRISGVGLAPNYSDGWQGISPFVIGSVLWSLYSFLRSPHDYWETICTAIAVGGDVDTTAAMAGAISGAYVGLESIPEKFAHRVTDQGIWGFGQLLDLAHECYSTKMRQRT